MLLHMWDPVYQLGWSGKVSVGDLLDFWKLILELMEWSDVAHQYAFVLFVTSYWNNVQKCNTTVYNFCFYLVMNLASKHFSISLWVFKFHYKVNDIYWFNCPVCYSTTFLQSEYSSEQLLLCAEDLQNCVFM
jgi:hypothetical protein